MKHIERIINDGYLDLQTPSVDEGGSVADEWPNVISNGFSGG